MFHESKSDLLKIRASFLKKVRAFFDAKGMIEVDTPILSKYATIDAHIDLFELKDGGYLQSSPEYRMKELLSQGLGDIYQLGHVFRKGEKGRLHSPEFTMIEWYRNHTNFHDFLEEALELCSLFLKNQTYELLSYNDAFKKYLGISPSASIQTLCELANTKSNRTDLLNILWGNCIEPQLGKKGWTIITQYPKDQAALSQLKNGYAERFEIYFKGIELGNGYHELRDPIEQKERLNNENNKRMNLGKKAFPIDPYLTKALEKGLPDCYGIAIGFDRLLMLHLETDSLDKILPF